ncbi:hypothetical protein PIB30_044096 [Stylosanthes scabra]|uniref:Uncharacterized protein n=1 Tax=Stylosanthes scabra TaxID=79078 RepID=A0ABU6YEL6_9FABA|nr:hypothetical protein [Stylosanthes scabra]
MKMEGGEGASSNSKWSAGAGRSVVLWLSVLQEFGTNSFCRSGDGVEDMREHFSLIQVENRVAELEYMVAAMEKKKNIHVRLIVVAVLVGVAAIYVIGS